MRLLVACPRCRRQFDASNLAAGSRFHCACGEALKVPEVRARDAAVVRCSSCGAPRRGAAALCTHCGTEFTLHERDMHTICPGCMTRVSDRARFCHHCAIPLTAEGNAGESTRHPCPACGDRKKLNSRRLGEPPISVLECPGCAGFWLGNDAFRVLLDRNTEAIDTAFEPGPSGHGAAAQPADPNRAPKRAAYLRCPRCTNLMHRRNYGGRSGVLVDTCREHGIWFDAHELARILRWVRNGGQAAADRRQLEEERSAAWAQRLEKAVRPAHAGGPPGRLDGADSADLFGSLLGSLFRG